MSELSRILNKVSSVGDTSLVSEELDKVDAELEKLMEQHNEAKDNEIFMEFELDKARAQSLIEEKTKGNSLEMCKSIALVKTQASFEKWLIADSKMRGLKIKVDTVMNARDRLKERLANLRTHAKTNL